MDLNTSNVILQLVLSLSSCKSTLYLNTSNVILQ
ncbi:Uncharacterised protein [Sarcina ventriculi]|uniref:Uncharacterized protein n=1 Tax=Sarcina ventriculi TaxID=1267 RepID=A0ABP2AQ62_SARVE|nr:Uncharacterised protein [Sarcina ventriculi]